jgi:DNA polymerase elongation subunit (family B)
MDNDFKNYLKNILFLDIETISAQEHYDDVSDSMKHHWHRKASYFKFDEPKDISEVYFEKAGIYAEFGRVICIGFGGFIEDSKGKLIFKAKTIGGDSEKELLNEFSEVLANHKAKGNLILCAHNGKEFDFPYLCRRFLVNGLILPEPLRIAGRKPWEINHLDTLELWKFGDYKHYTSLDLLASLFDIPSSKSEISGANVNKTFYSDNDLPKIMRYCTQDVVVLAQLYLKMNALPTLEEDQIQIIK